MKIFSPSSPSRRYFLKTIGFIGITGIIVSFYKMSPFYPHSIMKNIYYKILKRFRSPVPNPPREGRMIFEFPQGWDGVSVEKAMNSRCSSDYDENQEREHWGVFDRKKTLSDEQVREIVKYAQIPRFTDRRVEINVHKNVLSFVIDNTASGLIREWMMVESGMFIQTVGLLCSAMGAGMRFNSQGIDGISISANDHLNIKLILDAMAPSYNGSYWIDVSPLDRRKLDQSNLPDPVRDGEKSLVSVLTSLKREQKGQTKFSENVLSQLLWSARGKVPHLYYSKPWGMTIPTWEGKQDITSVYYVSHNRWAQYENWNNKRPVHNLVEIKSPNEQAQSTIMKEFGSENGIIVIGRNEKTGRALWETGFQLQNMIIQANSLDIAFKAKLLVEKERDLISNIGLNDPVAVMII